MSPKQLTDSLFAAHDILRHVDDMREDLACDPGRIEAAIELLREFTVLAKLVLEHPQILEDYPAMSEETTKLYRVAWYMPIEAATPSEAASIARGILLDPENIASYFAVTDPDTNETLNIDALTVIATED